MEEESVVPNDTTIPSIKVTKNCLAQLLCTNKGYRHQVLLVRVTIKLGNVLETKECLALLFLMK